MATRANYTKEELDYIAAALELAQTTQGAFWDALRELEEALGDDVELDLDDNDLENYEVDGLLALVDKEPEACRECGKVDDHPGEGWDGLCGNCADKHTKEEEGRPGQCLTCATQCSDEGICPKCAALETAQEAWHAADCAKDGAAMGEAQAAIDAALNAYIGGCAKCGTPLTLRDTVQGNGCTDDGEGPEAGRVFLYCTLTCLETH